MNRFVLCILALGAAGALPLLGQNTVSPQDLERRANEERYTILNSKITSMLETQEILLTRLGKLEQRIEAINREVDRLKEQTAAPAARMATHEELKVVVEKLQEIDRKREADNKLVLESLRELRKLPPITPPQPKPAPERTDDTETYDYVVKPGDFLGRVIEVYNLSFDEQGKARITLDQVKRVNPGLDPNSITPGQTIRIPIPPKK